MENNKFIVSIRGKEADGVVEGRKVVSIFILVRTIERGKIEENSLVFPVMSKLDFACNFSQRGLVLNRLTVGEFCKIFMNFLNDFSGFS